MASPAPRFFFLFALASSFGPGSARAEDKGAEAKKDSAYAEEKARLACEKYGDCEQYNIKTEKDSLEKIEKDKDLSAIDKKLGAKEGIAPIGERVLSPAGDTAALPAHDFAPGSSGGGGSQGAARRSAGPSAAEAARTSAVNTSRQQRAFGSALRGAQSLKQGLPQTESLPEGGLSGKGPLSPSRPETSQDLIVASYSGFAGVFRDMGLKAGSGPGGAAAILTSGGQAASPAQLAALKERIAAEPAALMRRPDFFQVLPRASFQVLKSDFQERPELRQSGFRDIDLTTDRRDFLWSASCSRVSGDCNPYVQSSSYRRGDDVPPEDLGAIFRKVAGKENAGEEEADGGLEEYTEDERKVSDAAEFASEKLSRSLFSGSPLGGLGERLAAMGAAVQSFFGGGSSQESGAAPPASAVGAPGGSFTGPRAFSGAGRRPGPGPDLGLPLPPHAATPGRGRWGYRLSVLAALLALVVFGLKRKRG